MSVLLYPVSDMGAMKDEFVHIAATSALMAATPVGLLNAQSGPDNTYLDAQPYPEPHGGTQSAEGESLSSSIVLFYSESSDSYLAWLKGRVLVSREVASRGYLSCALGGVSSKVHLSIRDV
jgi:hypothetical protein